MSFTGKLLSVAALSSLAVSAAFAQSLPPSVAACASEKDSLARLVCFDREVAKYSQLSTSVAPKPATPSVPEPPAPAVATTPRVSASPSTDEFGVSGDLARKRAAAKGEDVAAVKELRAAVTKISSRPFGELILELDNGQVWQQNEKKSTFIIKVGDTVVIKPAKFGSFMLSTEDGATSRVHRTR